MSGTNTSFGQLSLYVGSDWRVRCIIPATQPPILTIDAGETAMSLCLANQEIRPSVVEFAAELAKETAQFAAEVERRYAEQLAAQKSKAADPAA